MSESQDSSQPPRPRFRQTAAASPLWLEVADYLAHLRIERDSSTNTLASYERDLARYIAYLAASGVTAPSAVTATGIADFLRAVTTGDDGGTGVSESSASRMLASVRGVHKYWAQEGRTDA